MLKPGPIPTSHTQAADYLAEVSCLRLGQRGQLYSVTMAGALLVSSTRDPEPAAARELQRRGNLGTVQFVKAGQLRPYTLPLNIASLAGTSHEEGDMLGVRARPYKAWCRPELGPGILKSGQAAKTRKPAKPTQYPRTAVTILAVVAPFTALLVHLLVIASGAA